MKVRFNLGAGKNFMKWKVSEDKNTHHYYEPSEVVLVMHGCKLRNQKGTAKKIFDGANKTVCAWVDCDSVEVVKKSVAPVFEEGNRVSYNPRVKPFWMELDANVDGKKYDTLVSNDRNIFTITKTILK